LHELAYGITNNNAAHGPARNPYAPDRIPGASSGGTGVARVERILARAAVEGLRRGANPATWREHLQEALPSRSEVQPKKHFRAMDYRDVPVFMVELGQIDTVAAASLRFVILTAARTGEVIGGRWNEVDWNEKTWTVPGARVKTGLDHVVPLSTGALAVLRGMESLRAADGFIFPGRDGADQSGTTMLALLQRQMGRDVSVHGFRSCFRDWAGDEGDVPRELAEGSLGHVVKSQVERAYRRRSAVGKRRTVMQSWSDYCLPPAPSEVVNIAAARQGRASAA
jgi:integrase